MDQRDIGKESGAGIEGLPPESAPRGARRAAGMDGRTGPTWRGWMISILVAVILSVAATVLFGGGAAWRTPVAAQAGGCGGPCCPPAGR